VVICKRYISDGENLKQVMQLMKDKSRSIQMEAFHVFRIFLENSDKPRPVLEILVKNQKKLLDYLESLQPTKGSTTKLMLTGS